MQRVHGGRTGAICGPLRCLAIQRIPNNRTAAARRPPRCWPSPSPPSAPLRPLWPLPGSSSAAQGPLCVHRPRMRCATPTGAAAAAARPCLPPRLPGHSLTQCLPFSPAAAAHPHPRAAAAAAAERCHRRLPHLRRRRHCLWLRRHRPHRGWHRRGAGLWLVAHQGL